MGSFELREMKLAVISHKFCRAFDGEKTEYATDGGFPLQMKALSSLFSETRLVVPCALGDKDNGLTPISGNNLEVVPLYELKGSGLRRKIRILAWLTRNAGVIWKEIQKADAVHTPIPGDVGTIGIVFAMLQRKPLFVRHCGNWLIQKTLAERVWKWGMEFFAGGRNVMLVTGGGDHRPSRNENIQWIFSTSRTRRDLETSSPRVISESETGPKLIIACRQEPLKGTEIVIEALPEVLKSYPQATLGIVGDGSLLDQLRYRAFELGLESRVKFYGKVPQDKVISILSGADLFCYPTNASEGFPKVVLEAMSVGLPVISTRVSVLQHLINQRCGILLDEATPISLSNAIVELYADKRRYEEISRGAIEVSKPYTLEAWTERIREFLIEAWVCPARSANLELPEKMGT
jgi:glycosyltransferase involved in cell wall biosynthesis